MPLNGGGTASRVPGTSATPNQTIKSADYNAEMDDVYGILNTARPIAYGGTGATDAAGARANLGIQEAASMSFGQCYLRLNGSNLQLIRNNGKLLTINGAHYEIPSSGVSLSPSGLSASTVYYIYAYMNSGTMTLEASTTARTADATTGMPVKTGDPTRTLVGWARTGASTEWSDTTDAAHVISFFNPRRKVLVKTATSNLTFTSTTMTKISNAFDVFFLAHPDYGVDLRFTASAFSSAANIRMHVSCGLNSTVYEGLFIQPPDTGGYSVSSSVSVVSLAEATNYTGTAFGAVSTGTGTIQYQALFTGFRPSFSATVWG